MSAACWTGSLLLVEAVISDSVEVRHLLYVIDLFDRNAGYS